ncbi:hypothetical protein [Natronomonas sp. LN261]|uniref:DUF7524 family protein n=1 Tax=Natronomonas sp. LN261 TaxID=2750669 RepID=UPI0015EEB6E4|nr:hypothetical protein [Natronomonas sp. LN261]
MTDSLAVAVNRDGLHTLAVPTEFEANGPFDVKLYNHGEAAHVYLNVDDRLSEVARIRATNHYVGSNESRRVRVETRDPSVWPEETVRGTLEVVVGHGQETRQVRVTLDPTIGRKEVPVDPDLTTPKSDPEPGTPPVFRVLPVVVLGSVAVLLAAAAVFAGEGVDVAVGGLGLVSAGLCAVAAYYLLR